MFRKHERNMHRRVARRLRQEYGWSLKSIANVFGCSENTIRLIWLVPYRAWFTVDGVRSIRESLEHRHAA